MPFFVLKARYCFQLLSGSRIVQFRTYKIVYRRYAGLFFTLCVDVSDNELLYLEAIHLFVEILDHYFQNVCELDLVFNFHKVGRPGHAHSPMRAAMHTHATVFSMWFCLCACRSTSSWMSSSAAERYRRRQRRWEVSRGYLGACCPLSWGSQGYTL